MKQSRTKLKHKNQNIMDANLRATEWLFTEVANGRTLTLELLIEAQKIEKKMIIEAFQSGQDSPKSNADAYYFRNFETYED